MSLLHNSLRVVPANWLEPLDLTSIFGAAPPELEVDLGCGKGRFLLARAQRYPQVCFLGIDRLLLRILRVERAIQRLHLTNIRLLYAEAAYALSHLLPSAAVSVYYIFFPDPWPKRRHHRRRLFAAPFLDALHRTLRPAGRVHIATDHDDYFAVIKRVFAADSRFMSQEPLELEDAERTDFEMLFLRQHQAIHRCSFSKVF